MKEQQITIRTEGQSATVALDEDKLNLSVAQFVADVAAPAVMATEPLYAQAFRALAVHPKASFCLKQEDADGVVEEKFVARDQSLRDLIEEKSTAVALDMERAADGGDN